MLFNDKQEKLDKGYKVKDITIQVTGDCNLACTYCYLKHKNDKMLNIEYGKRFIEKIITDDKEFWNNYLDLSSYDGLQLQFIGGEPMCNYKTIIELVDYYAECCKKYNRDELYKNTTFGICTNGTIYNKTIEDFLIKYKGKVDISISIDGCKELHDTCRRFKNSGAPSYDIVINNLYKYRKLMPDCRPINTKATISPENITYLYESVINLLEILDFNNVPMNVTFEGPWTIEHARYLYKELKRVADWMLEKDYVIRDVDLQHRHRQKGIGFFCSHFFRPNPEEDDHRSWCGGNGQMLFLQYDGKIYNCNRYSETAFDNPERDLSIGDIEHGIINTENVKKLRSVCRYSMYDDECLNCPIGVGCADCVAYCWEVQGEFKKLKTICDMHKARSLANVYFWNKYYMKNNINKHLIMHLPYDEALKYIDVNEVEMLLDISNRRYINSL